MRYTTMTLALTALLAAVAGARADDKAAFFNGKDLTGWEGLPEFWSAAGGALVGRTEKDPGFNTFLCTKKKYGDFELSFKVRLKDGVGNSGVQVRSEVFDAKKFRVRGPQVDIGKGYWGSLYGENFGGMMKQSSPETIKKVVKEADFNDYAVRCAGKRVTVAINGATMVDGDFPKMPDEGVIALQLHAGYKSMEVTFKDIQFKELTGK